MTLEELEGVCSAYIEHGHGKDLVVVNLDEPSVGTRAGAYVDSICPGFDWEHGQMRIICDRSIISRLKDRDRPLDAHNYMCPKCGNILHKNDHYCCRCGQAVSV